MMISFKGRHLPHPSRLKRLQFKQKENNMKNRNMLNFTPPEFNLAELRKLINRVVFAVPKREGAHAPSILLLGADGQAVRAFGTDGHRLAVAEAPARTKGITERRCFAIPRDAVPVLKALPGSTVEVVSES